MEKEGSKSDKLILQGLEEIFSSTETMWEELREKEIFLTGATGFFGIWLLKSFIYANNKLNLNSKATVLTRDPESFQLQFPSISSDSSVTFHKGDIRDFKYIDKNFSHIIHGATTTATETFNRQDPLIKLDTVAGGTRNILDFATQCNCKKFLLLSSGSVYGKQPSSVDHLSENYTGAPFTTDKNFEHSVLGESKRISELLTTIYSEKFAIETKIARCFSFVGPYLPLNIHYAVGNFIRDSLKNKTINISGDGTPIRSYLYITDLIIWLWTLLFEGKSCEIYNVGSEREISMKKLAELIAKASGKQVEIIINTPADNVVDRYLPSTTKAQTELGVKQTINLESAIKKTVLHIEENSSFYNI